MSERDKKITVPVTEDTREDWKAFADEHSYSSMSDMVRTAVMRERHRHGDIEIDGPTISQSQSTNVEVDLSGIEEQLGRMETMLRGLTDRVDALEARGEYGTDDELDELALRIKDHLPQIPEGDEQDWYGSETSEAHLIGSDDVDTKRVISLTGRRDVIQNHFAKAETDVSEADVQAALDRLVAFKSNVKRDLDMEGNTRYYILDTNPASEKRGVQGSEASVDDIDLSERDWTGM